MYFAWSKTKKTEWRKKLNTKWRHEVLNMCLQRSTVMEFCINVYLGLFLENAFKMAKHLSRRRPRGPSEGQNVPLIMRKLRRYFPLFLGRQKTRCALRASLQRKDEWPYLEIP